MSEVSLELSQHLQHVVLRLLNDRDLVCRVGEKELGALVLSDRLLKQSHVLVHLQLVLSHGIKHFLEVTLVLMQVFLKLSESRVDVLG